jgi:hypothetical protein
MIFPSWTFKARLASSLDAHAVARLAEHLAVDVRAIDRSGSVLARRQGVIGAAQSLALAELLERREGGDTRGPSELFRGLVRALVEEDEQRARARVLAKKLGRRQGQAVSGGSVSPDLEHDIAEVQAAADERPSS